MAGYVHLGHSLLASGSGSVLSRFPFSLLCTLGPCRAVPHGRVWGGTMPHTAERPQCQWYALKEL